jgi:hypothetical protein
MFLSPHIFLYIISEVFEILSFGKELGWAKKIFSSPVPFSPVLGPALPPLQWIPARGFEDPPFLAQSVTPLLPSAPSMTCNVWPLIIIQQKMLDKIILRNVT